MLLSISESTHLDFDLEDDDKLFLKIWSQIGKVNVLPLLSSFRHKRKDLKDARLFQAKLMKKEPFKSPTFWKDLLALGTDLENLASVTEIMFYVSDMRIIPLLKDLLKKVKKYWESEEIMGRVLKLINELYFMTHSEVTCDNIDISVLSTVSVLLSLLFKKCPSSMNLRMKSLSLPSLWLEVISDMAGCYKCKQDLQPIVKIVRQTFPITVNVVGQLSKNYRLAEELINDRFFDTLLTAVGTLLASSNRKNDLSLVIESDIMAKLLQLVGNRSKESDFKKSNEYDYLVAVIERFILILTQTSSSLSSENRVAVMPLIATLISTQWLYRCDKVFFIDMIVDHCICVVVDIAEAENGSERFVNALCEPNHNVFKAMIEYATRHNFPQKLEFVAMRIHIIVALCSGQLPKLTQHLKPLLSICLNHVVKTNEINRLRQKSGTYGNQVREEQLERFDKCYNLSTATMEIYKYIVLGGTIDELKKLETEFKILEPFFKAISMSKRSEILVISFEIISEILEAHHFDFISSQQLVEHMPLIWRKMKVSQTELVDPVAKITYTLALFLPNLHFPLNFSEWEPTLVQHAKSILQMKPISPGFFRLAWEMIRLGNREQLFDELLTLASDRTVGYAAPGKSDLAKIFRLISELLIGYLENDPPFNTRYLTHLTHCMVEIARSSTLDEELYVLEDMVSPAMWLLDKQNDEKIVANVKEFINILH